MYTPKKLNWNSLSDFREHLLRDTKEEILEFTGYSLTTKRAVYHLLHGKLSFEPRKKSKKS